MSRNKLTIILIISLLILSMISIFIGAIDININNFFDDLDILFISRLPRLLAILCTGMGMSTAGLIMQQLCANKFVSPTTGATISSAQLGILIAMIFFSEATLFQRASMSFIFAIIGTWIYVWFAMNLNFKDTMMLPLIGIMFSYIIGGITSFIAYKFEMSQALSSWLVGHFSLVLKGNYEIVYLTLPLIILAFIFSSHFNIVGMGKNFSKNLGINYNVVLFLGLSISAMISASVVVVVGSISYIGLIIPNIITIIKGDKIKGTIIDTALLGAIFVLISDIIARSIIHPFELPIDLIIGIVGSIMFILLIIYRLKYQGISIKEWRKLHAKREIA